MAEQLAGNTPVKVLSKASDRRYVCKYCNSTFSSRPIDLFGENSKKENLSIIFENVTGLAFTEDDGFPKQICAACHNSVKHFKRH